MAIEQFQYNSLCLNYFAKIFQELKKDRFYSKFLSDCFYYFFKHHLKGVPRKRCFKNFQNKLGYKKFRKSNKCLYKIL